MRTLTAFFVVIVFTLGLPAAAQDPRAGLPSHGVVADDDLTLVVGTRFVEPTGDQTSPTAVFRGARVPLASFNDTDRCIDEAALETATAYFTALGRILGKSGHYYYLPDDDVDTAISRCEATRKNPPKAFVKTKTKIMAFGQVVPTKDASALEETLR